MLYFFDTRDNGTFIEDDVGIDFADLGEVKTQAALSRLSWRTTFSQAVSNGCFRSRCVMLSGRSSGTSSPSKPFR